MTNSKTVSKKRRKFRTRKSKRKVKINRRTKRKTKTNIKRKSTKRKYRKKKIMKGGGNGDGGGICAGCGVGIGDSNSKITINGNLFFENDLYKQFTCDQIIEAIKKLNTHLYEDENIIYQNILFTFYQKDAYIIIKTETKNEKDYKYIIFKFMYYRDNYYSYMSLNYEKDNNSSDFKFYELYFTYSHGVDTMEEKTIKVSTAFNFNLIIGDESNSQKNNKKTENGFMINNKPFYENDLYQKFTFEQITEAIKKLGKTDEKNIIYKQDNFEIIIETDRENIDSDKYEMKTVSDISDLYKYLIFCNNKKEMKNVKEEMENVKEEMKNVSEEESSSDSRDYVILNYEKWSDNIYKFHSLEEQEDYKIENLTNDFKINLNIDTWYGTKTWIERYYKRFSKDDELTIQTLKDSFQKTIIKNDNNDNNDNNDCSITNKKKCVDILYNKRQYELLLHSERAVIRIDYSFKMVDKCKLELKKKMPNEKRTTNEKVIWTIHIINNKITSIEPAD